VVVFEGDVGEAGVVGESGEADALHRAGVGDVELGTFAAEVFEPYLHLGGGEGVVGEVERGEEAGAEVAGLSAVEEFVLLLEVKGDEGDGVLVEGGVVEGGQAELPGGGVMGKGVETPAVVLGLREGFVEAGGEIEGCVGDDAGGDCAEGAEFFSVEDACAGGGFIEAGKKGVAGLWRGAVGVEEGGKGVGEGSVERLVSR
jgi:hypothetical protein